MNIFYSFLNALNLSVDVYVEPRGYAANTRDGPMRDAENIARGYIAVGNDLRYALRQHAAEQSNSNSRSIARRRQVSTDAA